VNWNISFTKYDRPLQAYYKERNPLFLKDNATAKQILQDEKALQEIVQLVGKDSLSEDQKVTLELARLIREDFLAQNAFSDFDYTCPLVKTAGMLRCLVRFYDLSIKAVRGTGDKPVTWGRIRQGLKKQYDSLTAMKFIVPNQTDEAMAKRLKAIEDDVVKGFQELSSI